MPEKQLLLTGLCPACGSEAMLLSNGTIGFHVHGPLDVLPSKWEALNQWTRCDGIFREPSVVIEWERKKSK